MFTIEFHNTRVREQSGTSKQGKEFRIRKQDGFIYLNNEPYPTKFVFVLGNTQPPYEPGTYELTPEFFVGQYGDLRVGMRDAIVERVKDAPKAVANG